MRQKTGGKRVFVFMGMEKDSRTQTGTASPQRLVMGVKQTLRALRSGCAACVIVAEDAARQVIGPVEVLAREGGVPLERVATMRELGHAGGLQVGCACAARLK